jgi:hypothetical protein
VIHRTRSKNLTVLDPDAAPAASSAIERDGFAVLPGVLTPSEVERLRTEIDDLFVALAPARNRTDRDEFRYEALNHSAACQAVVAHPGILAVVEPLLGDDCHVIANTAWRNPPEFTGGFWHCDAGPHVPRPEGVPWDDRIPYPIFAIGAHVYVRDCTRADGPTAVVPGSHRSGRLPPVDRLDDLDLTYDGRPPAVVEARAGDVALFASDAWHRGLPAGPGARGRCFLQVHYGRRDIAQRIRTTNEVHHLSADAVARATTERERTVVGLHPAFYYDG